MDSAVIFNAAGEELPGKGVGDPAPLDDLCAATGLKGKFHAGEQKQKGKFHAGEQKQQALLDVKLEKDKEQGQEAPLLDINLEKEVSGWNAQTGTSLREEQKASQATKAENAAGKKGLGYFCYSSHGAYKPKF